MHVDTMTQVTRMRAQESWSIILCNQIVMNSDGTAIIRHGPRCATV